MCSVIILFRPAHDWPLIIAANRDEMVDRPWDPPGRHWPDRPYAVAGRDRLAGGSWMGVNDHGVVAAILNREGTLGPQAGKRSRGELVLEALDHNDAQVAVEALADLDGRAYRGFNMVVADNCTAYWVRADGGPRIKIQPIPAGVHMLTAKDLDDTACPRIARHLSEFRQAPVPDPETGDWGRWPDLLTATGAQDDDGIKENGAKESGSMCFLRPNGFGTVSSCLLALPSVERSGTTPLWLFSGNPLRKTPFEPVPLA